MITGLGIGLVGFGLILAYAGVTGQHVKQELTAVFTGQSAPAGTASRVAAPAPASQTAPPSGGTNPLPGKPGGPPLLTQPQPGMSAPA